MNQSSVKNMVVLKNLPSNIVEEAIVILKNNKKAKKLERVEKNKAMESKQSKTKENDYVLKEAEMLIANYISKLEEKKSEKKINNTQIKQKYKRLKNYAYTATFIMIIETLLLLVK